MRNSPLNYVGGKRLLRKKIIAIMPEHTCYVEVFVGAGWVFFGKEPSKAEVINDLDGELVNFYQVIKNRHQDFIDAFEWHLMSREIFRKYKEMDPGTLYELERAVRFYYLLKYGYAGRMRNPSFGTATTRIKSLSPDKIKIFISDAYERLQAAIIENLSFDDLIPRYDRPHTLFYLDPPYVGTKDYRHNFETDQHHQLAEVLRNVKGKFILSYNDNRFVRNLYKGYKIRPAKVRYSVSLTSNTGGRRRQFGELIITNY